MTLKELSKTELRELEGGRTCAGWVGYIFGYMANKNAGICASTDPDLMWTTRGGM
ncbi:hypothetical protein [Ancylomarina longa]|uniref:hypothetical protein n=1 Tax=Ancylomarina longa TaxID=2487017 RepID=UPI001ADE2957|nr:hypothetical protein [Ancylomarina longa]